MLSYFTKTVAKSTVNRRKGETTMSYPTVRLLLDKVQLEETFAQTMSHFDDPNYGSFLMVGELDEYRRFISSVQPALEFLSNEPAVVQRRKFIWTGCRIQILSCHYRYYELATIHAIASNLTVVEIEPGHQLKRGFGTVTFPFLIGNLRGLMRTPRLNR